MDSLADIYDSKYRAAIGQQDQLAPWHEAVLNTLRPLDKQQLVLEVGCGNGRLLVAIAALGFDTIGIDLSPEAVELCRDKGLTAQCVDISKGVPFREQIDICVCVEVIEHILDSHHFLGQLNRALKPGATAIMSTPNFGYYAWQRRYLRGESPSQIQNPLHIRFFTASYLGQLLSTQGFRVLRMYSPLQRAGWTERAFSSLGLQRTWDALTRRWGKTLLVVARKVGRPRYTDLAHARSETRLCQPLLENQE